MKLQVLVGVIAGVYLANNAMAQSETGLPGVWQLNKEKSTVQSATAWAKTELTGETFSVILRTFEANGKEEASDWKFSLGPGESSNKMHGATMKSHVTRDGDAVVVQSVTMFGPNALKTVDRWFVSDAGKTLTFEEKHQFAAEPEGMSLFVFERRPESAWPAPAVPKLAEESYKNIQILKGMPAERLSAVMASFTTSLGVSCKSCHVDGDFASDAKPAKQTARKMWNMAAGINHDSFGSSGVVTCWTCHRGSVKPESQPADK